MSGWLGDLGRLSWGLLYWNLRKTIFRFRGGSSAPCQHPSDSGLAGKTGCEASLGWRDLRRFTRLCPLLAVSPEGRRVCSVSAAHVRPFWGRACVFYAGTAAVAAVISILAAFGAFHAIGYRVPLRVVAWPPAWHEIRKARADYFYRMALRALAGGDIHQSYLALSQVHSIDPGNAEADRLLAQFTQLTSPEYSDALYSRLVLGHSGDFEATAQVWLRALISRSDFPSIAGLSSRMLREGGRHAPAWTQGILFAERMSGDPGEVDRLLNDPGAVPAEARSVLSAARSQRAGSKDERIKAMTLYLAGAATPFEVYYALERLEALGHASQVVDFLEGQGNSVLDTYDRETLELDAYSLLGWHDLEANEMGLILSHGVSAGSVSLIAAHLIRYPHEGNAAHLFNLLESRPLAATAENCGSHVALLCVAGVNGLGARMKEEADVVGGIVGGAYPAWDHVRDFFESRAQEKNPSEILPALGQLPLDVMYALCARYHVAAAAGVPGQRS